MLLLGKWMKRTKLQKQIKQMKNTTNNINRNTINY